jgi:hypothetical protein
VTRHLKPRHEELAVEIPATVYLRKEHQKIVLIDDNNVELCPVRDHDACLVTSRPSRVQRLPDGLACEGLRQQSTGRPPLAALRAGTDPRELVPEAVISMG